MHIAQSLFCSWWPYSPSWDGPVGFLPTFFDLAVVKSLWQLSWDKVCFILIARDWLCFGFAELLESFPFLGSLLVSRNCRLSGLVCDLWGPWRWLFGSRICDAASLVSLADVRSVCGSVTSLFICCCPFGLSFYALRVNRAFAPFMARLCLWGWAVLRAFGYGSAGSLNFTLSFD